MINIYITGHACESNAVVEDRYWAADNITHKLYHIGTARIDHSFLKLLVESLGGRVTVLHISDEEFKKLMLQEGYLQ